MYLSWNPIEVFLLKRVLLAHTTQSSTRKPAEECNRTGQCAALQYWPNPMENDSLNGAMMGKNHCRASTQLLLLEWQTFLQVLAYYSLSLNFVSFLLSSSNIQNMPLILKANHHGNPCLFWRHAFEWVPSPAVSTRNWSEYHLNP